MYWIAFYEFPPKIGVQYDEHHSRLLKLWETLAKSCFWCYPYKNICFICDRPSAINMQHNRLHNDGGPSVEFRDGWKLWSLHGVRVPQWLAETKDTDIDPHRITEITNDEVRREFVAKVGLERIRHTLKGRTIDAKTVTLRTPDGNSKPCRYELVELDIGHKVRVLAMDNMSIPVQHVEYVGTTESPCHTVDEALNFRFNRTEADIDDVNGAKWYMHGDVIAIERINGEPAAKFRRWPEWAA